MDYRDEAERTFAESLEPDERMVFDMFVSVRNGKRSAREAFEKVREMALAEEVAV